MARESPTSAPARAASSASAGTSHCFSMLMARERNQNSVRVAPDFQLLQRLQVQHERFQIIGIEDATDPKVGGPGVLDHQLRGTVAIEFRGDTLQRLTLEHDLLLNPCNRGTHVEHTYVDRRSCIGQ